MTTVSQQPPELELDPSGSRRLLSVIPMAPAGVLVTLWLVWVGSSGGYYPTMWYPSALGCLSLLAVTLAVHRRWLPEHRSARLALLAYAGLVAWNYLSILWAAAPGSALGAANEMLLYLLVGWTLAIVPWTPQRLAVILGIWSVGVGVFCVVDLLRAVAATHRASFFVEDRWATPLGYPNGTGALAMMAMLPAVVLSSCRDVPRPLRILLMAVAVFLAEFALLPQSRAVLVGVMTAVVLVTLFAGDRWRLLARLALIGAGLAITVPGSIAVNNAISDGRPIGHLFRHTAGLMGLTSLAAMIVGGLIVLAEERWGRPSRRPRAPSRRLITAVVACAVLAVAAGAVLAAPPVIHYVRQNTRTENSPGANRLLSISPEERFDYARVALDLFVKAPVLGVGAGNFGREYDRFRRFQKHSQYTHNLTLRVLGENGIPGLVLFALTIFGLAWGLVRAITQPPGLSRACRVAVLGLAGYFLVHASLDWMDEFPALAAPALALSLAAAVQDRRAPREASKGSRRGPLTVSLTRGMSALRFAGAVVAVAGITLLLTGPYLSTLYVNRALSIYPYQPAAADRALSRASTFNPLSTEPLIARGTIDEELHEPGAARAAFANAVRKQLDWYPLLQLALLDAQAGRFPAARAELARAARLDAQDPLMPQARAMLARRQRIDPLSFNQLIDQGPQASFFGPQTIK